MYVQKEGRLYKVFWPCSLPSPPKVFLLLTKMQIGGFKGLHQPAEGYRRQQQPEPKLNENTIKGDA